MIHRYRPVLIVLAAVVFGAGVSGCRQESGSAAQKRLAAAAAAAMRGPVFAFYDGLEPLAPDVWANARNATRAPDAKALSRLSFKQVQRLAGLTESFRNGIEEGMEHDPVPLLVQDLPALMSFAESSGVKLEWIETERVKDADFAYMDAFSGEEGTRIYGTSIAMYLSTFANAAKAGRLKQHASDDELAEMLFWIGYNFYKSDDRIESSKPRQLVIGTSWAAAMELREKSARESRNAEAEQMWLVRQAEWTAAWKDMRSRTSRVIEELLKKN